MEAPESLAFAQRRERLAFKWAFASAMSGILSAAIVAVSLIRKAAWLPPPGTITSIAILILLVSIGVFTLSFLAWLVWMRRRRRLEADALSIHSTKESETKVEFIEPSDPVTLARKQERLCFKTSVIFASVGILSFLAIQTGNLWFQWVAKPAAIRAFRMGDRHAAKDFFEMKQSYQPFFLGAAGVMLLCMACFAIFFMAWLIWMIKRRRLEANTLQSH